MRDFLVIGGGIVGLATARELLRRHPSANLTLIEKEARWASHQSGRNSGVIHSGIYYRPGSLKAELARAGNEAMVAWCRSHRIPVEVCGKLILASDEADLPRLEELTIRAADNGIPVERLGTTGIETVEPHARGLAALHVRSAAITDYTLVCRSLAEDLRERGAELLTGEEVVGIERLSIGRRVRTTRSILDARFIVACAGLQSDRIAWMDGVTPEVRIIPFRGEYWDIIPSRRHLVRALIYPVPDPAFPFLGVHLTRMIGGSVHAGPNAVLNLSREEYARWRINAADLGSVLTWPGFWRLALRHLGTGWGEVTRSLSHRRLADSVRRLVPGIRERDLVRATAGIRAQAVTRNGLLADDFLFASTSGALHVLNAPSPAATASFPIASTIVDRVERTGF
ncbi:MAG: L-2-hydroxyglutarate oxidase [Thermoanaerobaculia bacterium]